MRLIPIQQPLMVAATAGWRPVISSLWTQRPELTPLRVDVGSRAVEGRRNATVKSQGAYKLRSQKTIMKKMGAKRVGDQYVIPGNIIYKQRGTIWHPGENTIMGRQHTIHAAVAGYVKYYRDPAKHPKRQYIGVAWNREDKLPYPPHAIRKRKLGMITVPRKPAVEPELLSLSGIPRRVIRKEGYMEMPTAATATEAIEAGEAAEDAAAEEEPAKPTKTHKKETRAQYLARRWNERIKIKRSNRVLLLQKDYSYAEKNSAIGRLMGKHRGKTPGTIRYGSRHGALRARRRTRERRFGELKAEARQKKKLAAERAKERLQKLAERAKKEEKMRKAKDA